jgi:hypothetical protein
VHTTPSETRYLTPVEIHNSRPAPRGNGEPEGKRKPPRLGYRERRRDARSPRLLAGPLPEGEATGLRKGRNGETAASWPATSANGEWHGRSDPWNLC